MKRIIALLLLCALLFTLAMAFASCDFQDDVDSLRSELMEGAKELLDPFLNRAESGTTDSSVLDEPSVDSGINA